MTNLWIITARLAVRAWIITCQVEAVVGAAPSPTFAAAFWLPFHVGESSRVRIHHYGHGGAGFTLAWGGALEAVTLAENWIH